MCNNFNIAIYRRLDSQDLIIKFLRNKNDSTPLSSNDRQRMICQVLTVRVDYNDKNAENIIIEDENHDEWEGFLFQPPWFFQKSINTTRCFSRAKELLELMLQKYGPAESSLGKFFNSLSNFLKFYAPPMTK